MTAAKIVNGIPVYVAPGMVGWVAWADVDGLRIRAALRKTAQAAVKIVAREVRARTKGVK